MAYAFRVRRVVVLAVVVLAVVLATTIAACRSNVEASDAGGGDDASANPFGDDGSLLEDPLALDASVATRAYLVLAGCNGQEACHASGVEGLTFPAGDEARYLVDAASTEQPSLLRVKPGDPEASYLVRKVRGDPSITGERMPASSATFDPRLPALFEAWVEAGAPRP